MEFLAEQGWYVLRMGASVEKPIYWKSPRIIDYASEHRSPFMDVWLVSQCHLAISTGLGLDAIPTILKKPLIYTNMPFLYWPHGNYAPLLILHKHFYHSASRVALTRLDVMRSHHAEVFFDKDFHDANLSVLNNTAGEILEITKEMLEIIDGKHTLSPEDIRCQKHFWETLAAYVTSLPQLCAAVPPRQGEFTQRSRFLRCILGKNRHSGSRNSPCRGTPRLSPNGKLPLRCCRPHTQKLYPPTICIYVKRCCSASSGPSPATRKPDGSYPTCIPNRTEKPKLFSLLRMPLFSEKKNPIMNGAPHYAQRYPT